MSRAFSPYVTDLALLTPSECAQVRTSVQALREHWIQRHPVFPFYTLGASNYFDLAYLDQPPYGHIASAVNPALRRELGWLYERLAQALSRHLQAPVVFAEPLALPGFHVFLAHKAFEQPRALTYQAWMQHRDDPETLSNPIHCDTPHGLFDWGMPPDQIDFENPISITLAISLPSSGAGMVVWDLHRNDTLNLSQDQLRHQLEAGSRHLHAYRLGHCAVHSGFQYHQIAPFHNVQPDDVRITLQGHGLRCRGQWRLFW